jgi:hypothetical protein
MVELQELFEVKYGVNLELNSMELDENGINFVSRTAKNNGVSAKVKPIDSVKPIPAGVLTVAGGGSVLETFLQTEPFYSGRDLYYLIPKIELSETQKLFYCACIRENKYKYNYGRQANRTLKNLLIPSIDEIPDWLNEFDLSEFYDIKNSAIDSNIELNNSEWKEFRFDELFTIKKGKRLTKADMLEGEFPFIGSTDSNNGITNKINQKPNHQGNVITVNYNGSVGEAFYQPVPFYASDDVNILYPKKEIFSHFNQYIGLFIIPLIRANKFRFNYGRKWHKERMEATILKLPINSQEMIDVDFMERYIKTLPFSSKI